MTILPSQKEFDRAFGCFLEKISPEPNSGCWIWTASTDGKYGNLQYNKRLVKAHRFAWEAYKGAIPVGLFILHKCDNTFCVNPSHLFVGTLCDNMKDCGRKGRNGMQRHPERNAFNRADITRPYGEAHGMAELTVERVKMIMNAALSGCSSAQIAGEFGISAGHARKIVSGKAWRKALAEDAAYRAVNP